MDTGVVKKKKINYVISASGLGMYNNMTNMQIRAVVSDSETKSLKPVSGNF